jgi:type II secretory pathway pseudopilin PulG
VLLLSAALLAAIAIYAWQESAEKAQWEKQHRLLFIGNQLRQAIGRYYEHSPGPIKQYPRSLSDLLDDPRTPTHERYLSEIYVDPMTGERSWGLVRDEQQAIVGAHSLSNDAPMEDAGLAAENPSFAGKKTYSEWIFTYTPAPQASSSPPPLASMAPPPLASAAANPTSSAIANTTASAAKSPYAETPISQTTEMRSPKVQTEPAALPVAPAIIAAKSTGIATLEATTELSAQEMSAQDAMPPPALPDYIPGVPELGGQRDPATRRCSVSARSAALSCLAQAQEQERTDQNDACLEQARAEFEACMVPG